MDLGTLRVTTPDGQVREYPLDVAQVFIGRAEGNRVVIDHVSVSRRHARLEFSGGVASLEDLGSATGTYAGGQRLAAGTPRTVAAGEPLRFGDCQAILIASGTVASGPRPSAEPAAAGRTSTSREQAIAVSVTAPSAPVAPGSAVTITVAVQNRSNVVDNVTLAIQGLPEGWARITRPVLQLLPDARDEVVVVVQPPKEEASRAGEYQFAAAATSSQNGVQVRALGRLAVLPFGGPALEVRPVRSRRDFTVSIENQSNRPGTFALQSEDPEDATTVDFVPAQVELDPAERAAVRAHARLRKRRFFGAESRHPMTFEVEGNGQVATATAELQYRPPWLIWRFAALAVLIVAIGVGAWVAYSILSDDGSPRASPGDETPTAEATTSTPGGASPTMAETAAPATPTPDGTLAVGSTAVVINSPDGECLFVRQGHTREAASAESRVLARLCNDSRVTITGARVEAEGYYWYPLRTQTGVEGWSAEGLTSGGPRFLAPAP